MDLKIIKGMKHVIRNKKYDAEIILKIGKEGLEMIIPAKNRKLQYAGSKESIKRMKKIRK